MIYDKERQYVVIALKIEEDVVRDTKCLFIGSFQAATEKYQEINKLCASIRTGLAITMERFKVEASHLKSEYELWYISQEFRKRHDDLVKRQEIELASIRKRYHFHAHTILIMPYVPSSELLAENG